MPTHAERVVIDVNDSGPALVVAQQGRNVFTLNGDGTTSGSSPLVGSVSTSALSASALKAKGRLPVVGFNPSFNEVTLVDSEALSPWRRATNPSPPIKWRGYWWIVFDGNDTNGAGATGEAGTGQKLHILRGAGARADTATWTYLGQPFGDAALASNPVVDSSPYWFQPNLIAPQGDAGPLHCYWQTAGHPYFSTLAAPTALWLNRRIEFLAGTATPVLSSTLTGAAAGGNSTAATLDGATDLAMFFPANPLILSDGRIAIPVTLYSASNGTNDAAAITAGETAAFYQSWKANAVLFSDDLGASFYLSETIPNGSAITPAGNWEHFLVESDDGDLYSYNRNLSNFVADANAQVVAVSKTKGLSWSPYVPTELRVNAQRAHAVRAGSFWVQAHTHYPASSSGGPPAGNGWRSRRNPALGLSRSGRNDFLFSIPYGSRRTLYNYPQLAVEDGVAYVASGRETNGVVSLTLGAVSVPTDASKSYATKSRLSELLQTHGPTLVAGSPGYWEYDETSRTTAPAWNPGAALTICGWVKPRGGAVLTGAQSIVDTRNAPTPSGGVLMRTDGATLNGVTYQHTVAPKSVPSFYALRVDTATRIMTSKVFNGSGSLQSFDRYLRAVTFSGVTTDGDTLTVDGTVFTFKTASGAATEVTIGANLNLTANNLVTKLRANGFVATTLGSGASAGDVVIGRTDGADFTTAKGSADITLLAGLPATITNVSTAPNIGVPVNTTTVVAFVGDVYDLQGWGKALSDAEVKDRFNQHASDFGYAPQAGASAPSGSPDWRQYDGSTTADFSNLADKPYGKVTTLTASQAVIAGEGSVALDSPWPYTARSITYQCGALPASTDKYVIATIGTVAHAQRLYIDGSAPTSVKLDGTVVATVLDPTRLNKIEIVVSQDSILVGTTVVARTAPGLPRIYLGNAFPEGLLAYSKTMTFDLASMWVAEYRDNPQAPALTPTSMSIRSTTADGSYFWQLYRQSEVNPRVGIKDSGEMWWGPGGATVPDTRLLRVSAAALKLVGMFQATDDQTARHDDSTKKVIIGAAGLAGGQAGITFGSVANETMFWKSVAKQITTDSEVKSSKSATGVFFSGIVTGDTNSRVVVTSSAAAGSSGAAKIQFGPGNGAADVNLFWDAAATLKTDATFRSSVALGTAHVAAATPTGGSSGDIKIGNGKIWVNDAGTWKSAAVA